MAGYVPFGQNLQLQSGVPLDKVASVFMEKLTVVKRLDGGGGGGSGGANLMAMVVQSGDLSAIMQNPMAALTNIVQGQLGGLVSQLQGMVGGAPQQLVDALTGSAGLGNAMSVFKAAGDNLAGLTNGAQGFMQMIGHASTVSLAGSALPPAAAMPVVTAPLDSASFLSNVSAQLPTTISNVVAGTMTVADATDSIHQAILTAAGIVSGSAGALAWSEQTHAALATVATVSGAMAVPPTFDATGHRQEGVSTAFQGVLSTLVQPGPAAAMRAGLAAMLAGMPAYDSPDDRAALVQVLEDAIAQITSLD